MINCDSIAYIKRTRRHPVFHGKTKLPDNIMPTTDVKKAVSNADLLILAIPSKCVRAAIKGFKEHLPAGVVFLNVAKGLEAKTNMRVAEIVEQEIQGLEYEFCVLSGGMIAREVTLQNPLCADIACENIKTAKRVAKMLASNHLRIESTTDVIGVSLAGAFKNVIAIGAGIFDGLGYGESSKSAFVSSVSEEIIPLAVKLGADNTTFGPGGQAWFGDLMTTCFGASRNRELGELIGRGIKVKDAVDSMINDNKSIEGYLTTKVVHNLLKKHNINTPLIDHVYDVLYNNKQPSEFVVGFIKAT